MTTNPNPQELPITQQDMSQWLRRALEVQANFRRLPALAVAERAVSAVHPAELDSASELIVEQIRRRLSDYAREPAAAALSAIADVLGMGSACRTADSIADGVMRAHDAHERDRTILRECRALFDLDLFDERDLPAHVRALKTLSGTGELTAEHDSLENAARAIAEDYTASWTTEPTEDYDGVLVGSRNEDDAMHDFIRVYISDYSMEEGDDEKLAQYIALARPGNIAAMFDLIRLQRRQLSESAAAFQAQATELAQYKSAFAQGVGEELERIAPGGALLDQKAI